MYMRIKRPRKDDVKKNLYRFVLMRNFRKAVADKFGVEEKEHLVIKRTIQVRHKSRPRGNSDEDPSTASSKIQSPVSSGVRCLSQLRPRSKDSEGGLSPMFPDIQAKNHFKECL